MRNNQPVTQQEFLLPDDATLLSVTDTKGRITYANAAFVAVSGFERAELLGQPHNLVRHPDMPAAAFADMWQTLERGESWLALVKNRRKNGDYYWVRANATPVHRGGRCVGYLSVRSRPTREEVAAAETLYRRMREGTLHGRALHMGLLVRTGALAGLSLLQRLSLAGRVHLGVLAGAGLTVAGCAAAGLGGTALLTAGVCAALGAAAVDAWLQLQIVRPLGTVLAVAQAVAAGNPDHHTTLDRVDEIGRLLRAINQAGLNLRSLVDDVSQQTDGLHVASAQIAAGNMDLSARTEQTAGSLQRTAASMDELNATVRQNADSARQASERAQEASTVASRGGQVVGEVVTTMQGISQSSRRIADIISVIDGIAFQTNILALNAAVEAACAGEQGRGFAVVAAEVRALARRSADAAREIKDLITASTERVDQATGLVDQAGRTMAEVVESIQRLTDIMATISLASQEQSQGVAEIGEAVGQMDQSTQQNAALVEQSAAAAESLRAQAQHLVHAVQVFRHGQTAFERPQPQGKRAAAQAATAAPAARAPAAPRKPARPAAKPGPQAGPPPTPAAAQVATGSNEDWETF